MKHLAIVLIVLLLATTGAKATSSLFCKAQEENVGINLTIGSVVGEPVVEAELYVGDKISSTMMPKNNIAVAQSFFDGDKRVLDISDSNFERIIARLRLFIAIDEEKQISAGTLQIDGEGVFAVSCSGP